MKLDTMREFLLLSVNRNFSKTAEELYIAQSALSRHVAALEQELGVQLVHRTHNTFELTPAGEIAAEGFRDVLQSYKTMLQRLAALSENFEGELHVGALYYNLDWYIYPILEVFRSRYPKVKLHLHSYQPAQLVADAACGKVDIGFGNDNFIHADKLFQTYPFWKVPFYVFFDHAHPLADQDEIAPADLEGQTLITFQDSEYIRYTENFLKFLHDYGISPTSYIQLSNFDELPVQLRESGGVCIMPAANPKLWEQMVCFRPLKFDGPMVDMLVFWRRDNRNPAILLLRNIIDSLYPP